MFRFRQLFSFVIAAITFSTCLRAQDKADDVTPPLVTKFYDISLLNGPHPHLPFDDGTPHHASGLQSVPGSGGFGGRGQAGGGGFFSLPAAPAQFGGGGAPVSQSGNGNNGTNGFALSTVPASDFGLRQQLAEQGQSLTELIVIHVAAESWENNGTGPGTITEVGDSIIVRQTEPVHQQVADFLRSLSETVVGTGTFQVEAWWLPVLDGDTSEVKSLLSGKLEEAVVLERLSAIAETEGGYHGTLLCRDRCTAHMASGKKVPVIAGSTPVVGTGSIGYSPQVRTLHLGLVLETRVTSVPDFLSTTADQKKGSQVEFNYASRVTSPDAQIQERATFEKVDRYVLGEHSAAGSCRLSLGTPTLVESLTQLSKQEEQATEVPPELRLVVRVTRTEE